MSKHTEVFEEDARLENLASGATEALAKLRWHWTLDESNPERYTVSEYARRAGRSQKAVYAMAQGYNLTVIDPGLDLPEASARAVVSAERAEVVEAVAEATGKTFQNVVKNNAQLASEVHRTARAQAERKGTSVSDEIPRAAKTVVASQRAAKAEESARRKSPLAVEGHLTNVVLHLKYALRDSDREFTDDEREFLATDLERIRSLLTLVELRITGETTNVDWDAELASLGGAS